MSLFFSHCLDSEYVHALSYNARTGEYGGLTQFFVDTTERLRAQGSFNGAYVDGARQFVGIVALDPLLSPYSDYDLRYVRATVTYKVLA